ncbi:MAG: hypothetical protein FD143_2864 [Ignavibacteria bacterium]|nr:MAG: hypothetical protein FD143_2864 [Ignavibacteria bacterium]KAF0155458.1 MAG: hypothetical protein FD188_3136 [Ignavibacteria bacterium]
MDMNVQVIKKNGEKEFAILPYNEFMRMKQILEDYEDLIDLRKAKAGTVNEPSVPFKNVMKNIKIKKGSRSSNIK